MINLTIICPTYNNEGSIKNLAFRVNNVAKRLVNTSVSILFVDDGSKDNTVIEIKKLDHQKYIKVNLVELTKNFGSYNSFLAGLHQAKGDYFVYLHADLQDPPELIPEMLTHISPTIELVIANRNNRKDGSIFSSLYHWLVKNFGIKDIPKGGFDLILFSDNIRKKIVSISEKNTNIVYLISWLGFPYVSLPYNREERAYGKSQWGFWKKVKLFGDTIFSFTNIPLFLIRIIGIIGLTFFFKELIYLGLSYFFIDYRFNASTLLISLIIIILEILTEYIWRIHETVRNRPSFVIKQSKNE